jgi:hypothetical protein
VAEIPAHADTIQALRHILDDWMRQQGDRGDQTEREAKEHQNSGRAEK